MDYNKCLDLIHEVQKRDWKLVFSDGTTQILRFPLVGATCDECADEKITIEVEVLTLIRQRTKIPVPDIYSWGLAAGNPLSLGAFILMEFIQGVSANHFLRDAETAATTQHFELDFDQIGSLPTPTTSFPALIRPLTWKVHNIAQTGGGLLLVTERKGSQLPPSIYFQYVLGQDWEQLIRQSNSVTGPYNAEMRYTSFKVLKSLVPRMVNGGYDRGPFKLICDDFGLASLILKSKDDLTVVEVVDLEWSYIGPAQLFTSAPWWLLQDRPINVEWDCDDHQPPNVAARYFKYLEMYKRVLEEEESKRPGHEKKQVSKLIRWSEDSGAMWLHMLLSCGFNDTYSFPFTQLRQHVGIDKWKSLRWKVNQEEVETFVTQKTTHLEQYDQEVARMEVDKASVDCGEVSREDFIAGHRRIHSTRYIRRKTNIPVPRVYAYGRSQLCRHATELQVFIIMEQIKGQPLTRKALETSLEPRRRLFLQQLVDVFAELRKVPFTRGGSLMPSNDEDIELDSPLDIVGAFSIRKNELQAAGYTASRILTTSAKEFLDEQLYILQRLWTMPCKDLDREQAEREEFAQQFICQPEILDRICIGPTAQSFFLAHPDLRPGNILVDDELNICGIIDWEYTASVPQCASAPPTWITGNDSGLADLPSEFACVLSSMKEKSRYHSQLAAEWASRDPLTWSLSHILIDPAELDFVFWESLMPNITGLCDIPIPNDEQLQADVDRRFAQYLDESNLNVEGREEEIQRLLQQARATIDQLKRGTVAHS
ncbi:hypothetical protein CEP53_007176 [Fusarium sp. AF-6]|nr:hypothetical protein CEP53_007176 [Fusarium sp. AF-6]